MVPTHFIIKKVILLEVILIEVLGFLEIASIFDPHKAFKA